jgi:phosphoglycolate phosphatase
MAPDTSGNERLDCVVLFDIDGTLIRGPEGRPSAGLLSMNRAAFLVTKTTLARESGEIEGLGDFEIARRFGFGDPSSFAGRTDGQIAANLIEIVEKHPPCDDRIERLVQHYVEGLSLFIDQHPYQVLGDPAGAVTALERAGAVVGLGTGNVARGAEIKLASCGLLDLFDISRGGYGDDGDTRVQVLRRGVERCDPSGARKVVIVGDTPRDVEAAHAIGAICIGVPFNDNTREVLVESGAEAVVDEVDSGLVPLVRSLLKA